MGNVNGEPGAQAIVGNVENQAPRTEPATEPVSVALRKLKACWIERLCPARSETRVRCCPAPAAERGPAQVHLGRSPAVANKKRCRMHGGAKGSGAPRGNTNALKHGAYTREALERRADMRSLLREARKLLRDFPNAITRSF